MNNKVISNYQNLTWKVFFFPLILLVSLVLFLLLNGVNTTEKYIEFQKDCFYKVNGILSSFPELQFNLTQLGDTFVVLCILSIFVFYAPKMWEGLVSGSLISLIFSSSLKNIFKVPRPAAVLDHESFVIIGKTLSGHSSLPSGHSITIFTVLTILMISFLPKNIINRVVWCVAIILLGILLIFSRVAVGAHFPLDVIFGGIIGGISGLLGIFFCERFPIWKWFGNKKFYPFFILLFFVGGIILIIKIFNEQLPIYYPALMSIIFSLYQMTSNYAKK